MGSQLSYDARRAILVGTGAASWAGTMRAFTVDEGVVISNARQALGCTALGVMVFSLYLFCNMRRAIGE